MTIARTPVESSNVAAIGHDPTTHELHVEFKRGGVYVYEGVTEAEVAELATAPSIGAHLQTIKRAHPCRKL